MANNKNRIQIQGILYTPLATALEKVLENIVQKLKSENEASPGILPPSDIDHNEDSFLQEVINRAIYYLFIGRDMEELLGEQADLSSIIGESLEIWIQEFSENNGVKEIVKKLFWDKYEGNNIKRPSNWVVTNPINGQPLIIITMYEDEE